MTTDVAVDARPQPGLLGVLAACSAVGVGTIYFPQVLLPSVAQSLQVPVADAALLVTAPQAGYAVGILALVPLGDTGAQRRLLTLLFSAVAACASMAAIAPSLPVLVVASFLMGCAAVAAPVIGPYAAGMTGRNRLGAVNSILLSVAIAAMIGSRAVAGFLGEEYSWRYAYLGAAVLALVCAGIAGTRLPDPATVEPVDFPRYLRRPLDQLVAGVLLLDVSMQSGMVANVTRMYRLASDSRSAMSTAYMVSAFAAGSAGSWTAVHLYHRFGWWSVPTFVAALAAPAIIRLIKGNGYANR